MPPLLSGFWVLLIQNLTLIAKNNAFYKKKYLFGLIEQTYKLGEDRMAHHNIIKFEMKKSFEERAQNK